MESTESKDDTVKYMRVVTLVISKAPLCVANKADIIEARTIGLETSSALEKESLLTSVEHAALLMTNHIIHTKPTIYEPIQ